MGAVPLRPIVPTGLKLLPLGGAFLPKSCCERRMLTFSLLLRCGGRRKPLPPLAVLDGGRRRAVESSWSLVEIVRAVEVEPGDFFGVE